MAKHFITMYTFFNVSHMKHEIPSLDTEPEKNCVSKTSSIWSVYPEV